MAKAVSKRFETPDEVRTPPKAKVEVVNLGEATAMRGTFEPGWKWSECVKPIAGTDSCEVAHLGYVVSGTMVLKMNDGTEIRFKAGDVANIPPGHDAWVDGTEPCVFLDFQGAASYAVPKEGSAKA
ncbi:MAG TPA: cupin domain-containing protein [Pyrinomonadaceae bacterium]|jgi:uncharacterized cupin superfamily protein|nr:cupin domain-containing protein [Pyrinomonadaceae bacterium]